MSHPSSHEFQAPPPPITPVEEVKGPRPTKLRIPAIILFALGCIMMIAGIAKILPGGTGAGFSLGFCGAVLFGLSFVPLPRPTPDSAPMSALETITGIFYQPSAVFKNLGAHPRWLAAFLVIGLLNIAYAAAFTQRLTPERIVSYVTEKMAQTPFIPPEAVERAKVEQLEQLKSPVQRAEGAASSLAWLVVRFAFIAVLLFLFVLVFGGKINYWQSFVVAVYSALPVAVIQRVISFILLYVKSPEDIHPIIGQETLLQDNLGILFTPSEHPVLYVAASAIGILSLYGLWLKAIGLRNAGTRVTSTAAWSASILYWVLGLALALIFTALFPAFIS
jgi:Yip1 domain